jgi:phenylacetate-CoA ligase
LCCHFLSHFAIKRLSPLFWWRCHWLDRTQWWSRAKLQRLQIHLLGKLVRHCYATVPYYREVMDRRHIRPEDIRTPEDIAAFPILSKAEVAEQGLRLVSQKYPRRLAHRTQTGGTTGTPIHLYRDIFSIANEHAFVRRQFRWAGIGLRDRGAILLAQRIADPNRGGKGLWRYNCLMKELVFSSYHLTLETARLYLEVMKSHQVAYMYVFPWVLNILCRAKEEEGAIDLRLRSIMTTAETLSRSLQERAQDTFGCRVFDNYGSSERVCYICSCEQGNYHVVPEYGYTEFVPVEGQSGRFRVVATGFWNDAMPLVRYDTGDIVSLSSHACPCGREFVRVESIVGRDGDRVRTVSGKEYGPAILTYLVRGTGHVLESRIVQDALDHVTIEYVPMRQFTEKDLASFHQSIRRHLPGELAYSLRPVEVIERSAGGKFRPVVSRIGRTHPVLSGSMPPDTASSGPSSPGEREAGLSEGLEGEDGRPSRTPSAKSEGAVSSLLT